MKYLFVVLIIQYSYCVFPGNAAKTAEELTEQLKFIETDFSLFAGESVIKEKLIVREILELKRSVFLLKGMLNKTDRGNRDIENKPNVVRGSEKFENYDLIPKLNKLMDRVENLEAETKEKSYRVIELEVLTKKLQESLIQETENRIKLQHEIMKLKSKLEG